MKTLHLTTQRQTGSALITALSILLILTLLGVSAMSTTALQERMAGNARDAEVAFEAAEAALRTAEQNLTTNGAAFSFKDGTTAAGGTQGMYDVNTTESWTVNSNWDTSTKAVAVTYPLTTNNAMYMIQKTSSSVSASGNVQSLEPINYTNNPPPIGGGVTVYQITARGFGLSLSSRVMLQSYFGR